MLTSSAVVGSKTRARPSRIDLAASESPLRAWAGRWVAAFNVVRATLKDPSHGKGGTAQLAVATVLLVPAWLGIAAGALVAGPSTTPSNAAVTILAAVAGQLAVGAAGVCVLRAWAAREVAPALAAAGFLAYGLDKLIGASSVASTHASSGGQVLAGACLVLAFGLLLVAAVHRTGANGARNPMSLWAGLLVGGLASLALLSPRGVGILSVTGAGGVTGNMIVTAGWSALALTAIYAGRREADEMKIWIGFTALCLAQGRLVLVVVRDPGLSTLASQVLQTIAVALTLFGAIRTVQEIIATGRGRLTESLLALQSSETRRREEADAHEEAVHSLRSAMTAISSASHLLVFGGKAPLADADRTKLAVSLQAALDRAHRLLRREWDGGMVEFAVLDLLNPIVVN